MRPGEHSPYLLPHHRTRPGARAALVADRHRLDSFISAVSGARRTASAPPWFLPSPESSSRRVGPTKAGLRGIAAAIPAPPRPEGLPSACLRTSSIGDPARQAAGPANTLAIVSAGGRDTQGPDWLKALIIHRRGSIQIRTSPERCTPRGRGRVVPKCIPCKRPPASHGWSKGRRRPPSTPRWADHPCRICSSGSTTRQTPRLWAPGRPAASPGGSPARSASTARGMAAVTAGVHASPKVTHPRLDGDDGKPSSLAGPCPGSAPALAPRE